MRTMFKGFAAAVIAAGFSVGVAHAETKQGTPVSAVEAGEKARPAKEKRYCVQGTITGSRLAQKDCRTRAEWLKEGFDPPRSQVNRLR